MVYTIQYVCTLIEIVVNDSNFKVFVDEIKFRIIL